MSGIAPISGNFAVSSASASASVGATSELSGTAAGQMLSGALALQVAGNMQAAAGAAGVDPMATLALALLLQRGNSSEEKQDPLQTLAMLSMLGGMQQGASASASVSFSMSTVEQAYAGGAVAAVQLSAQA